MSDILEEDFVDDTIYVHLAEDEHNLLLENLEKAMQSIEWISGELGACMHKGKSATGTLLAIKSIVDEFESGMTVFTQRNMSGEVVYRHVGR